MKFKHSKAKSVSSLSLDITPLVDVVFNLLIFFALTLNFVSYGGIDVNLPAASSVASEPIKENIVISLDENGSTFYNEDQVSFERLRMKLRNAEDKRPVVIINADKTVLHGEVVRVMDLVTSEGFSKLSIAVEN